MITRVAVTNFKRFQNETLFDVNPKGLTFLAGGNNSGKSTLLQALAIWEFCRSLIEMEQGAGAFLPGFRGHPVGLTVEEFTPIALPDLKHLWHNLNVHKSGGGSGYSLKIACHWSENEGLFTYQLGFMLSLVNDRLFVKPCDSNLNPQCRIPQMAYLPPFAGIQPKEQRMSSAQQKRLIGQGLAGGVLRNFLYELWDQSARGMANLRGHSGRISGKAKALFLGADPWTRLSEVLEQVFKVGLTVEKFNELHHTTIKVTLFDGQLVNAAFVKKPEFSARDIMVEGSGFLQWLSVYALAVNPRIDVLLLDEPDAHLHPSLQNHLVFRLNQLAVQSRKQALIATHSTTVLSEALPTTIYRMDPQNRGYLQQDMDRIGLFDGLGSQYAPKLDQLKKVRRLLIYEGYFDAALLKIWSDKLKYPWPNNLVEWHQENNIAYRKALCRKLGEEIRDLKTLSIVDRDENQPGQVNQKLCITEAQEYVDNFGSRMWKRTNIENYLMVPEAIARAANCSVADVIDVLKEHSLFVPPNHTLHKCPDGLLRADGKRILISDPNSIGKRFKVDQIKIAEAMEPGEIADDVKTLLQQIQDLCR